MHGNKLCIKNLYINIYQVNNKISIQIHNIKLKKLKKI
jgi:hypothetical protein